MFLKMTRKATFGWSRKRCSRELRWMRSRCIALRVKNEMWRKPPRSTRKICEPVSGWLKGSCRACNFHGARRGKSACPKGRARGAVRAGPTPCADHQAKRGQGFVARGPLCSRHACSPGEESILGENDGYKSAYDNSILSWSEGRISTWVPLTKDCQGAPPSSRSRFHRSRLGWVRQKHSRADKPAKDLRTWPPRKDRVSLDISCRPGYRALRRGQLREKP